MKKTLIRLTLALFLIATAFAGAFLKDFNAQSEGDNIRVKWSTGQETNVKEFVVERKIPNGVFSEIAKIPAKGSNSNYSYLDESAYKSSSNLTFIYRLKINDYDGQISYSSEYSIQPSISGVKRTWGSIKAMFR